MGAGRRGELGEVVGVVEAAEAVLFPVLNCLPFLLAIPLCIGSLYSS